MQKHLVCKVSRVHSTFRTRNIFPVWLRIQKWYQLYPVSRADKTEYTQDGGITLRLKNEGRTKNPRHLTRYSTLRRVRRFRLGVPLQFLGFLRVDTQSARSPHTKRDGNALSSKFIVHEGGFPTRVIFRDACTNTNIPYLHPLPTPSNINMFFIQI